MFQSIAKVAKANTKQKHINIFPRHVRPLFTSGASFSIAHEYSARILNYTTVKTTLFFWFADSMVNKDDYIKEHVT